MANTSSCGLVTGCFNLCIRESNLQQCIKTVYGESATAGGLPQLSPQVKIISFHCGIKEV